ncbi:MAG TPA: STAS domain-containing protein [Streptosporangiaceae bacterium]|nr:STAS domain-containing protein [Streptosporangiaceae bacterium]
MTLLPGHGRTANSRCQGRSRRHGGLRRVVLARPGSFVRRQSCQRRPGRTTTWFCRNRDGHPTMAPHGIDQVVAAPALSVRGHGRYAVVAISGELDIGSVPVLREQILGLLGHQDNRIVIDLSGVTFCDVSGLAMLVGIGRRVRQRSGVLHLAAPTPLVAALLQLTGLDSRFEISATVPEP